jgi:hypothetical protein
MLVLTPSEEHVLNAVYTAVKNTPGALDYMKHEPTGGFFMLSKDKMLDNIDQNLYYTKDPLNDSYLEWAFREVQFIARNGYDEWAKKYTKKNAQEAQSALLQRKRDEFISSPMDMTLKQQLEVLAKHGSTPMSYSEMHERFG